MKSEEAVAITTPGKQNPPASWKHLRGLLIVVMLMAVAGFVSQSHNAGNGQLISHQDAMQVYVSALISEGALLFFCRAGARSSGQTLASITGGRWKSWRDVAIDLAIAAPFWVLWELASWALQHLVGASDAELGSLLPRSASEIAMWILVSIMAGICEELAFRGFLQQQLRALTGSLSAAIIGQAVVFGIAHAYQGVKEVIVIIALGALFGLLAAWRGNLRANMMVHATVDIWEGWLKFVLMR